MQHLSSIPFTIASGEKSFVSKLTSKNDDLSEFINAFSSLEALESQIDLKKANYTVEQRLQLLEGLKLQGIETSILERLSKENTFTITTGHQLNLLTGPLYSIYKIATVIKIAEESRSAYPDHDFIPVFWMATEDHDFEEINHVNLFGEKISWETNQKGPVGKFELKGIEAFKEAVKAKFRECPPIIDDLLDCYNESDSLAVAHRKIIEVLFENKDLLIIDGDSNALKKLFVPSMKKELDGASFEAISKVNLSLEAKDMKVQAHVRDINLFYIKGNYRNRITKSDLGYKTSDNEYAWTKDEIYNELDSNPENFSPNVLFRPIYQETILPNLMYVGGGGELSYWSQLKASFESFGGVMPLIQLRYSATLINEKQWNKWLSFEFNAEDLFSSVEKLEKDYVGKFSTTIELAEEKQLFIDLMNLVEVKSNQVNNQLDRAIESEKVRILKQLDSLEKRIQKNQKSTFDVQLNQIKKIKNQLFPNNSLQERVENLTAYISADQKFISSFTNQIDPFDNEFHLISI